MRRKLFRSSSAWTMGAMLLGLGSPAANAADLVDGGATRYKAAPHRNVYRVEGEKEDAADRTIWSLAEGAFNTAVLDLRRAPYYRQAYFYGGTPYYGRQFYGSPVYYGGPYYTYYRLPDPKPR